MAGDMTWYGDGIYSKARTDPDGAPFEQFFVRVWVPSEKRARVFKAGRGITSAKRLRDKVRGNPEAAVKKRQEAVDRKRNALTVKALYQDFTTNYRGRGGTDFYINVLKPFVAYAGAMSACDVTAQSLDAYRRQRKAQRTKRGNRPRIGQSTDRKECSVIAKMFKWARVRGKVAVNPFAEYETPRPAPGVKARALSYDEEDAMLAAMPPLDRDVATWALDTGMRRGEILSLDWARIDRAAGLIYVVKSKTGKSRAIPLALSDRLGAILDRHPQRTTTGLLFRDRVGKPLDVDRIDGSLASAMKAAKIPKIRGSLWNVLRKTWVCRIYKQPGVMPQDEADWAGHSMAVAQAHYREFSPEARPVARGLLNRPTVASGVANKGHSPEASRAHSSIG